MNLGFPELTELQKKKKKDRLRENSAFGAKNAMYGLVAEALHCTLIVNIAHEEY